MELRDVGRSGTDGGVEELVVNAEDVVEDGSTAAVPARSHGLGGDGILSSSMCMAERLRRFRFRVKATKPERFL